MKISTEHRDALNEALDETAGYEGDVYVFDVKHIEILRSAVIAMLEDDEQIAAVAPAVDAQPVAIYQVQTGDCWLDMTKEQFDNHSKSRPTRILYASAQSEGLRKDAWQPIETAPKDGTPLILFARAKHATASVPVIGWWIPDLGWIESAFSPNHPVGIVPSHWMPRPDFPAQKDPQ